MNQLKKMNLQDFQKRWVCDIQCGSCYVHAPLVPHNWLELPPREWAPPYRKCPSYDYFKFKAYTAVGRGNLASMVFNDKDFKVSPDLLKIVYTCTNCGMCSEICHRAPLTAIWSLREELVRRGVPLPDPLPRIDSNIQRFHNRFGAAKSPLNLPGIPRTAENIYFAGCSGRLEHSEITLDTLAVLKAAGMEIGCLGNAEQCCGFIPGHSGNTWLLEEQARKNIETLRKSGAKRVIVSCAHCYKALKLDYPLIAGNLPFKVVHVAELLAELIEEKKIQFKSVVDENITYQDPCFLGRHGHIFQEPRAVLRSIPGITLTEMERSGKWAYCCGSGANITAACYPEFSNAVSLERLTEAKRAAGTVVTACNSCFSQLHRTVQQEKIDLQVRDLSSLVAIAMGINKPG
jgi:heterodisulfide reductase subunit D